MDRNDLDGLIVDNHEAGVFKVNRRAFIDEQILDVERREIFDKVWLYAGHESELPRPNTFVSRKVGGRPLILTRDGKGKLHALLNSCPHRGLGVCRQQSGTTKLFTCYYHSWSFAIDGRLAGVPGEESYGPDFDREKMGLKPVARLESYRGLIFISYNPEVVDLPTYLGPARPWVDLFLDAAPDGHEIMPGHQRYSMRANWKMLMENTLDSYHATSMHMRYFRNYLQDIGMGDIVAYRLDNPGVNPKGRGYAFGHGHTMVEGMGDWTPISHFAKDEITEIRNKLGTKHGADRAHHLVDYVRNLFIYPNLIWLSGFQSLRTFYPVAPDYMEIDAWALLPKGESQDLRRKRIDNFHSFLGPAGFATPDDVAGLESCQRAFATSKEVEWTDVSRGMLSDVPLGSDELQMRGFWRQWLRQVRGEAGYAECGDRPADLAAAE